MKQTQEIQRTFPSFKFKPKNALFKKMSVPTNLMSAPTLDAWRITGSDLSKALPDEVRSKKGDFAFEVREQLFDTRFSFAFQSDQQTEKEDGAQVRREDREIAGRDLGIRLRKLGQGHQRKMEDIKRGDKYTARTFQRAQVMKTNGEKKMRRQKDEMVRRRWDFSKF